jgi:murein DD-endopeptidase MepM/ murein hydrolase activator NlpD
VPLYCGTIPATRKEPATTDFSRPAFAPWSPDLKSALARTVEELLSRTTALLARHPKRISAILAALLLTGTGFTFAVANLAPDASQLQVRNISETLATPDLALQTESLEALALKLYRSDLTRATDTAETLLKRMGVFDPQAAAYLRSDALAQKNLLGRAGRAVSLEAAGNNSLLKLQARWSPDEDGMFQRLSIEKTPTGFSSRMETLPLTASTRMASGTIASSLFAATDEARIPDSIATQLAEIFSGDIDFHRALRKGDRFSVVYETLEGDGEPLRAGRVLSTEFVNGGKTFQAMWFQEPEAANAGHAPRKGGYYTLAGESLRRAFLAAPLAFSRVTSGFKMRFHPILQVWRAHLGVDYAAPVGTTVRSVGDGVVEFAGLQNGFGNVVKVKHQNQTSTVYAHLSKINVRLGQAVSQGQNVGLVGMTGWATGPHLHFEYRVNGVYQDPQTIARRNDTVPVTAALKPVFDKAAAQARVALLAAGQSQLSSIE